MTDSPLVTVIIAAYNSSTTLSYAIQSVLAQEMQNFEIRVIGDACTDNCEDVVKSFNDPRIHWKNLPKNIGIQSGPNNEGIKEAKGKYVAYLGHDDLWFPWHLSHLVEYAEKNKLDLVFALSVWIGPKQRFLCGSLPKNISTYENHFAVPSSWLHRLDIIHSCGYWRTDPENLSQAVDHEFLQRVFANNKKMDCSGCLSLLKFPSPWWKSYSIKENYPQEPYLETLFHNPFGLQIKLLTEIATHLTHKMSPKTTWLMSLQLRLRDWWGKERFPYPWLKRWRYQRLRAKKFAERGLNPKKS